MAYRSEKGRTTAQEKRMAKLRRDTELNRRVGNPLVTSDNPTTADNQLHYQFRIEQASKRIGTEQGDLQDQVRITERKVILK